MIIEKIDSNREAFKDYSLNENILTIEDMEVDLEAEQEEQEKVLAITRCSITGKVMRGMLPCCDYLADVIIPPRKYEAVEVEDEQKQNEDGEPVTRIENVPLPLDLDTVVLRLWPLEAEKINKEAGGMYAE